jgi:uncharacterized membrane protein YkvA (DUF1232 family)
MQTNTIREMIKAGVTIERQTGNLRNALEGLAQIRGVHLNSEQMSGVIQFIRQYVEHAPALMDEIESAAKEAGIYNQIEHILDAAVQYFLAPVDLIPDHLGLLGLVDDAYLAHRMVQSLSDNYQEKTGNSLVPLNLTKANMFIRGIIGEPHASMLDQAVSTTINSPSIQQSMMNLFQTGSMINLQGPDPIWGNATIDEVVDARLGAMGVV